MKSHGNQLLYSRTLRNTPIYIRRRKIPKQWPQSRHQPFSLNIKKTSIPPMFPFACLGYCEDIFNGKFLYNLSPSVVGRPGNLMAHHQAFFFPSFCVEKVLFHTTRSQESIAAGTPELAGSSSTGWCHVVSVNCHTWKRSSRARKESDVAFSLTQRGRLESITQDDGACFRSLRGHPLSFECGEIHPKVREMKEFVSQTRPLVGESYQ